jgi:hypothetical protein
MYIYVCIYMYIHTHVSSVDVLDSFLSFQVEVLILLFFIWALTLSLLKAGMLGCRAVNVAFPMGQL